MIFNNDKIDDYNILYKYIYIIGNSKSCCGDSIKYEVKIANIEDFDEILMSSSMGFDHLPDNYFNKLHSILQKY